MWQSSPSSPSLAQHLLDATFADIQLCRPIKYVGPCVDNTASLCRGLNDRELGFYAALRGIDNTEQPLLANVRLSCVPLIMLIVHRCSYRLQASRD